jgi:hypothetical protein
VVGGAAISVAGGVVWSQGDQVSLHPDDETLVQVRDFRPPGIALVATGAPIFAAGVVMLAVDAHRQRRRRFAVAPHVSVGGCGLVAWGRF